jgi:imidazolonepropionase-like amidohydrolase
MRNLLLLLLLSTPAFAAEPALALRNATVETMGPSGRIEKATVVIRNGKIEAIGKDAAIPDDAKVIDAAGGTIMPGIIDPHFEVSVASATADAGPRTVVIGGRTITLPGGAGGRAAPFTRIADNFYPYDSGFKSLPRVGLTRLNLVAAGTGQSAIVRVTPGQPEHMMDRADGIAFVSVTNQTDSLDQIRTKLESAKRAAASATMARMMTSQAGGQLWLDVHEGKTPLIVNAANAATIVHLVKAVEPFKNVKLAILASGVAFAEALDSLKGKNVTCVVHPNLEMLPNTRDRFAPARMLHEAGIAFAFSLSARPQATADIDTSLLHQDFPLFPVAVLVKSGLPRQVALAALTKQPATITGMNAAHGSIEPGKTADLLLFTGDPLDPASRLRLAIVDGRTTHAND